MSNLINNKQIISFNPWFGKRERRLSWYFFYGIIIFILLYASLSVFHIYLNVSPSVPFGFYRSFPETFPTQIGTYVSFCPPSVPAKYIATYESIHAEDGPCLYNTIPFLKMVAALPGDTVTLNSHGVRINNDPTLPGSNPLLYIGKNRTSRHKLPHYPYGAYKIRQGYVWVYGPEWFSFDSRYYGQIRPIGVVQALFVYHDPKLYTIIPKNVLEIQK